MKASKAVSSEMGESPQSRIRRQQNRFSVLLVLLRSRLTSQEYRILTRLQFCSRQRLRGRSGVTALEEYWVQIVAKELDEMFLSLEQGQCPRAQLDRVVHVYADLFLLP